ncbi:cytidylyltransferase domain-containing protein [Candidatus Pelagisphaera phototrophica]|uniref:cytidylyltransferase domain-containing protein n=1 Tax=Candidatus Pelagisphaera phototrophica TaxID=2684113 RepID=UPI0019F900A4|nr:hypothetical protein [Candidatus Pelagisphaera phototrophica]QXD32286.1 hypothetical protein GA004_00720 [Candidatus Pelagisphaera phototrophica]
MRVVGSIIARLGSKRLAYKNLMPFEGKPHWGLGIEKLREAKRVDEIVVSTECELIARVALDFGAAALARPVELALDDVRAGKTDIHTLENLLGTYRLKQSERRAELLDWIHPKMAQGEHSESR